MYRSACGLLVEAYIDQPRPLISTLEGRGSAPLDQRSAVKQQLLRCRSTPVLLRYSWGNVSLSGFLSSLGCIDRWVRGRGVLRIGWEDADCKSFVAYSV